MILFWTVLILLLLFLLLSFTILRFHAAQVQKRQETFEEALWERRHRVPLLIEGRGFRVDGRDNEIIEIRAKLQSEAYTLEEQVKLEKKLTEHLEHLFQKNDPLVLALQKELAECLEKIRIAQNDYHFVLQKFLKLCRLPWFMIFKFGFEISKNKPLELI